VAKVKTGDLEGAVKDPYILTKTADAERARVVAWLKANPGNLGNPAPASARRSSPSRAWARSRRRPWSWSARSTSRTSEDFAERVERFVGQAPGRP
jgi:hypothetical protein